MSSSERLLGSDACTPEEGLSVVDQIATSGARLRFVGLGCLEQEHWIMELLGGVHAWCLASGPPSTSSPAANHGLLNG